MTRSEMTSRLADHPEPWDMIVVGGGATGVGVAIDAALRGYDILLLEQNDFGKGTSSRSTKLVHGGGAYLEERNIPRVRTRPKEGGVLFFNPPPPERNLGLGDPRPALWAAPALR